MQLGIDAVGSAGGIVEAAGDTTDHSHLNTITAHDTFASLARGILDLMAVVVRSIATTNRHLRACVRDRY
jgi:hypothetical protein